MHCLDMSRRKLFIVRCMNKLLDAKNFGDTNAATLRLEDDGIACKKIGLWIRVDDQILALILS